MTSSGTSRIRIYENWKADKLIRRIANGMDLTCGDLPDTGYTMKTYNGDNKTYFDIIGDALDAVLIEQNELYILYVMVKHFCNATV